MTKHRKILEGVSEGPWIYDGYYAVLNKDRIPLNQTDATFVIQARNQWPAICDLIDALGKYRESSAALEEHNCGAAWCPGNDYCDVAYKIFQNKTEDFHRLMAALDKLNEKT